MRWPSSVPAKGILLSLAFAAAAAAFTPAFAQAPCPDPNSIPANPNTTAIHFCPDPASFPAGGPGFVDVFVSNVPPPGLTDIQIELHFGSSPLTYNDLDPNSAVLDPSLLAAWGGTGNVNQGDTELSDGVLWLATSTVNSGPTGIVRVGTLRFGNNISSPLSGLFEWDRDPNGTLLGIGTGTGAPGTQPGVYDDGEFTIGTAVSDLTVTCLPTSPADPNFLVDGDAITLDCTVTNMGIGSTGTQTQMIAVLTGDTVVDAADTQIDDATLGDLLPTQTENVILSGNFTLTTPGSIHICTKVDVDVASLKRTLGLIHETDETNNVECRDVEILFPERDLQIPAVRVQSISGLPGDANLPVGSLFEVSYDILSARNAILRNHRNSVLLSTDTNIDPNDVAICHFEEPASPGILGGQTRTRTYGADTSLDPNSPNLCKIPFSQPLGMYHLGVLGDALNNIAERDPNNDPVFEGNNTASTMVVVTGPFSTTVRAHDPNSLGNLRTTVKGPTTDPNTNVRLSIISVASLAAYEFTLTWSDPNLIEIGDPNINPNGILVSNFIEAARGNQACTITGDPNLPPGPPDLTTGPVTVECTSTGSNPGATSELGTELVGIRFMARCPGTGSLSLDNLSASDHNGQPIVLQARTGSTYTVSGTFDVDFQNLSVPASVFPGLPFTISYELHNFGFADAPVGFRSEVEVAKDPNDFSAFRGDAVACFRNEMTPIPPRALNNCIPPSTGFQGRSITLNTCSIPTDLRPGNYSATFRHSGLATDPNVDRPVRLLPLRSRVLTIRRQGSRPATLESSSAPDPNVSMLASINRFTGLSIASLKSAARNLNFLATVTRTNSGRRVEIFRTPKVPGDDPRALLQTRLRLPANDKAVLGGADIDGDGEDELIVLQQDRSGEALDFREVDYTKRRPVVCQSLAVTDPGGAQDPNGAFVLTGRIVAAGGIQFETDPNLVLADPADELAVVTDDGGVQMLTIFDVGFAGSLPTLACAGLQARTVAPATAKLTPLATYTDFGVPADTVQSLCVMDFDQDPNAPGEELVSLRVDPSGVQSLRVDMPPTDPLGEPLPSMPMALDDQFGGTQGRRKATAIACTR